MFAGRSRNTLALLKRRLPHRAVLKRGEPFGHVDAAEIEAASTADARTVDKEQE